MSYGALLTDADGIPFYILDTMPLSLIEKRAINYTGGLQSSDLVDNDGAIRFIFVRDVYSDFTDVNSCVWFQLENSMLRIYMNGAARTINVFIFGYAIQSIPSWGIQINNSAGECVLTNETKPLRGVQSLGDPSSDSTSGYNISTTLIGSWAIAPQSTGMFAAVDISTGQPRPVTATYYGYARYNGSQTMVSSAYVGSITGDNLSNPSYINSRTRLTVVDVSRY